MRIKQVALMAIFGGCMLNAPLDLVGAGSVVNQTETGNEYPAAYKLEGIVSHGFLCGSQNDETIKKAKENAQKVDSDPEKLAEQIWHYIKNGDSIYTVESDTFSIKVALINKNYSVLKYYNDLQSVTDTFIQKLAELAEIDLAKIRNQNEYSNSQYLVLNLLNTFLNENYTIKIYKNICILEKSKSKSEETFSEQINNQKEQVAHDNVATLKVAYDKVATLKVAHDNVATVAYDNVATLKVAHDNQMIHADNYSICSAISSRLKQKISETEKEIEDLNQEIRSMPNNNKDDKKKIQEKFNELDELEEKLEQLKEEEKNLENQSDEGQIQGHH